MPYKLFDKRTIALAVRVTGKHPATIRRWAREQGIDITNIDQLLRHTEMTGHIPASKKRFYQKK
jgi:hypothetical protein